MKYRRSEIVSAGTFIVVIGWIWYAAQRSEAWNNACIETAQLKPIVYQTKARQDVADVRFDYIAKELDKIDRKLDQ